MDSLGKRFAYEFELMFANAALLPPYSQLVIRDYESVQFPRSESASRAVTDCATCHRFRLNMKYMLYERKNVRTLWCSKIMVYCIVCMLSDLLFMYLSLKIHKRKIHLINQVTPSTPSQSLWTLVYITAYFIDQPDINYILLLNGMKFSILRNNFFFHFHNGRCQPLAIIAFKENTHKLFFTFRIESECFDTIKYKILRNIRVEQFKTEYIFLQYLDRISEMW